MNSTFHIRRTTAILLVVIAVLVGALAATIAVTHKAPGSPTTALASTGADQIPLGSFAPIVKQAAPAVVNIFVEDGSDFRQHAGRLLR
jgi:S1-C subfamily serine protease